MCARDAKFCLSTKLYIYLKLTSRHCYHHRLLCRSSSWWGFCFSQTLNEGGEGWNRNFWHFATIIHSAIVSLCSLITDTDTRTTCESCARKFCDIWYAKSFCFLNSVYQRRVCWKQLNSSRIKQFEKSFSLLWYTPRLIDRLTVFVLTFLYTLKFWNVNSINLTTVSIIWNPLKFQKFQIFSPHDLPLPRHGLLSHCMSLVGLVAAIINMRINRCRLWF